MNGEEKKGFSRTVTAIYSPGTSIDFVQSSDTNNIICIYVEQEKQMNGKALVVSIRHKVKPLGQSPRYTMILRIVKASYKEQGGGNG